MNPNMNPLAMRQPKQQQGISLGDTTGVTCDKCSGKVFTPGALIRKVSPIVTGTGKPIYIPIEVFTCVVCNNVNKEFIPEELKEPEISLVK